MSSSSASQISLEHFESPSGEKKLTVGTCLIAHNIFKAGKTVGQGIKKTGDAAFKKVAGGGSESDKGGAFKPREEHIEAPLDEGMEVQFNKAPTAVPTTTAKTFSQEGMDEKTNKSQVDRTTITETTSVSDRSASSDTFTTASTAQALNNFRYAIKDAFSVTGERVRSGAQKVGKGVESTGNGIFVKPPKTVIRKLRTGEGTSTLSADSEGQSEKSDDDVAEQDDDFVPAPPDVKLQEMTIIHQKRVKGITSVQDYFDVAWSEGYETEHPPVYGPWLVASGKQEVQVSEWEVASDNNEFVGPWCEEKYSLRRTATFEFVPTISFGPPKANVKHTQFCRKDDDRCVIMMEIEMEGIPFADSFRVEIRWVATRVGRDILRIEIGLYVNFLKSTIVASKIRAGTTEETTKAQVSLFEAVKEALTDFAGVTTDFHEEDPEENEDDHAAKVVDSKSDTCLSPVSGFFHQTTEIVSGLLWNQRDDDLALSVRNAQKRLKQLDDVLEKSRNETTGRKARFRTELNNLHTTIDKLFDQMEVSN